MITSIHTLIYSDDAEATRAFMRDVLGWPSEQDPDATPPWPIFRSGPSEMAVHPTSGTYEGDAYKHPQHHSIALMCDDIEATVAELRTRGAEFNGEVADYGFGLGIDLKVPGAGTMMLYEPRHPTAY